jgi:hypothetical protein
MSIGASTPPEPRKRQRWLLLLPLACALLASASGYVLGVAYSTRSAVREKFNTPLARLGYRIASDTWTAASDFPPLAQDLAAAAEALGNPEGQILRLVVALRGLEGNGEPDLKSAAELCTELTWSRCDEAALLRMAEVLKK